MKTKLKLLVSSLVVALTLSACNSNASNQATSTTPTTSTSTINDQSTEVQKVGYAVGFDMGQNLKNIADDIDLEAFNQGLKDAYDSKDSVLTDAQMEEVVQAYMMRKQEEMQKKLEEKAVANKAAGDAFLAENAKKSGVQTTASGLQYKVINEGSGTPPKASDVVMVNYEGKLIDGTVFDSSYERGEPVEFPLNEVIPGWTEGVQLMKPGAKYEFYIPAELAYGETGNAEIEPNSTLIFTVELLNEAQADEARKKIATNQDAQMQQLMEAMKNQDSPNPSADKK